MRNFKLCLLFLTLLSIGCGKQVEEVDNTHVQSAQEVDSKHFILNYQHSSLINFQQLIPRNANFKIPEAFEFVVEEGITLTQNLHVFYNMNSYHSQYEFKCVYKPNNAINFFELVSCYNRNGRNLGPVLGIDFMLDEGKNILIQSLEVNSFEATILHQVDWK